MSGRKLTGNSGTAGGLDHAVPLAAILPGLYHPLIALPVERVVQLHPGFAILDAKLDSGPGGVALERHGHDVHVHDRHIQPGLRLSRVEVFDHSLADGVLGLNVFARACRQQQGKEQRGREQRDSFHFIDYTCLFRFAVTLPYHSRL